MWDSDSSVLDVDCGSAKSVYGYDVGLREKTISAISALEKSFFLYKKYVLSIMQKELYLIRIVKNNECEY